MLGKVARVTVWERLDLFRECPPRGARVPGEGGCGVRRALRGGKLL